MIIIEQTIFEEMVADALQTFPEECCGFFFGRENKDERLITRILVVNNSKQGDKTRRFEISPRNYLDAELMAEKSGLQLLGVYHSHPNHPAVPSEMDRLAAQPYFSYIILSIVDDDFQDIRSWRLNDSLQFEEEQINKTIIVY
ncbi:MAG: M67 family metallopeptidase [Flavisolibacter sp.]